jgi:2-amino-4-hydroxy-6-hydroxymethyldihydropteridine diphosphokinase
MNPVEIAYLSLGSNLGDKITQLQQALNCLNHTPGIHVTHVSSIYQTSPLGYVQQPPFYNLVVEIHISLQPDDLLTCIRDIEKKFHRVRQVKWGPRTMDIDIVLYGSQVMQHDHLHVPHPYMKERAFVLVPLFEIAGDITIPGINQTVTELIQQLPFEQEIHRLNESLYLPMYKDKGVK